jgi:hypothetical protein
MYISILVEHFLYVTMMPAYTVTMYISMEHNYNTYVVYTQAVMFEL